MVVDACRSLRCGKSLQKYCYSGKGVNLMQGLLLNPFRLLSGLVNVRSKGYVCQIGEPFVRTGIKTVESSASRAGYDRAHGQINLESS